MVVGCRVSTEQEAYRFGHRAGNLLLTNFVSSIFGRTFTDILSGYRVFSRRFVKSFPVLSDGFEIETELSVHALELALRACGVGSGDLVFTVSHTAVATVAAIELVGATPVLVDIDPATYTLDPNCLEAALAHPPAGTPKAIIPVHLYGHPADMPAIRQIVRDAAVHDYRWSSLVAGVATSVPFRMRTAASGEADRRQKVAQH